MDASSIIEVVKNRSGKSARCTKVNTLMKEINGCLFFMVFFASDTLKLCILMTNEEYEKHGIEGKNCVILKNLEHCTTMKDVPVFKMNSKSIVNESKSTENDKKKKKIFNQQEIDAIEETDVSTFIGKNSLKNPPKLKTKIDEKQVVITLEKFYEDYPSYSESKCHSIEVNVIYSLGFEVLIINV